MSLSSFHPSFVKNGCVSLTSILRPDVVTTSYTGSVPLSINLVTFDSTILKSSLIDNVVSPDTTSSIFLRVPSANVTFDPILTHLPLCFPQNIATICLSDSNARCCPSCGWTCSTPSITSINGFGFDVPVSLDIFKLRFYSVLLFDQLRFVGVYHDLLNWIRLYHNRRRNLLPPHLWLCS